jgi:hypothetical protein
VWVGIGGQFDSSLIQVGTEQDSINGQPIYGAWFELLPDDSISIDTMELSPEDMITASIMLLNESTDLWSVEIHDESNRQSFQKNLVYSSSLLSAEWIVERPTINNDLGFLANFGTVSFSNCSSIINKINGTIANFPHSLICIYDGMMSTALVNVSHLYSHGNAFNATFIG